MKFMKLSNPKIKKVVIYFMKLNFKKESYISGRNFSISKNKKTHSDKMSSFLGNGTF